MCITTSDFLLLLDITNQCQCFHSNHFTGEAIFWPPAKILCDCPVFIHIVWNYIVWLFLRRPSNPNTHMHIHAHLHSRERNLSTDKTKKCTTVQIGEAVGFYWSYWQEQEQLLHWKAHQTRLIIHKSLLLELLYNLTIQEIYPFHNMAGQSPLHK